MWVDNLYFALNGFSFLGQFCSQSQEERVGGIGTQCESDKSSHLPQTRSVLLALLSGLHVRLGDVVDQGFLGLHLQVAVDPHADVRAAVDGHLLVAAAVGRLGAAAMQQDVDICKGRSRGRERL